MCPVRRGWTGESGLVSMVRWVTVTAYIYILNPYFLKNTSLQKRLGGLYRNHRIRCAKCLILLLRIASDARRNRIVAVTVNL